MTTPRPGLPSFWVTDIAKVLVGDQPCLLQPWAKGHFTFDKQPESPQVATWRINHTMMLSAESDRLKAEGWKCSVEQFFRLTGLTAILAGKPDVIAQGLDGKRPKIVDCKSGEPKDADVAQVLLYLIAIPLAWQRAMTFDGEVVYGTHRVTVQAKQAEEIKPRVFALLRQLGKAVRPDPAPSESACRFCVVPDDVCSVRWKAQTPDVLTNEW